MKNRYILAVAVSLWSISFFNACSYSPSVTQVPEEDLVKYNPKHFTKDQNRGINIDRTQNENDLIIQAILHEMDGNFKDSHYFYSKLYDNTHNEEYLFRELRMALYSGEKSKNIAELVEWTKNHPSNVKAKRLLISLYINEKKNEKAKSVGKELVAKSGDAIDYELLASPYILSGEYTKAVDLLKKAYDKTYNEDILLKITTLLVNYIGDVDTTILYLENHRKKHQCSEKICAQLLEIYTKQQRIEPLLSLYEDLYKSTKRDAYAIKLVEGYLYNKNFSKAIEFLKSDYYNDELLYELYLAKKDYLNALTIANKLYNVQKQPRWLAESAMALYESAKDKNDKLMLEEVVAKFEQALSSGVKDSVYLNYYGYTLIDKDIDIEKGVKIVKDALKKEPDNSYYLDSLAWGYYKLNLCKDAYKEMKKVVDVEGLDEEDIAEHWMSIQQCNQK